ncbi:hypothetical protein ACQY0O_008126 [Thecaphora frezii]
MAADPATLDFVHLLRHTALQEAARRSARLDHHAHPDPTPSSAAAHTDLTSPAATATSDLPSSHPHPPAQPQRGEFLLAELTDLYHDENARNDALHAILHQRLDKLVQDQHPPDDSSHTTPSAQRKAKQVELARLEFELERLTEDLRRAPDPVPRPVSMLTTRAMLSDLCSQYATLGPQLAQRLATESALLQDDRQLLSDLKTIASGLGQRQKQVEARLDQERNQGSEEVLYRLRRKAEDEQKRMQQLLGHLIEITVGLFEDKSRRSQMRLLLEELMNRSWDVPQDPYVQVTGNIDTAGRDKPTAPRRNYEPALIELVVRANIAVQHPRDARKLRLVAFGKPTRARV